MKVGRAIRDIPGEFRVAYLYADQPEGRAIFSRDIFLDIIGRFVHLEKEEGKEALIFPRFHQIDAVLKIIEDARTKGVGHNYLIQHSAGSGKSNTIAWTAHRLIILHDDADKPIFDTAIIVTDRVVLDRQLQGTVAQFEQTSGRGQEDRRHVPPAERRHREQRTHHHHNDPEVLAPTI